jgi:hypothetical protein
MQIVVILGLSLHFTALAIGQLLAEVAALARSLVQTKSSVGAETIGK